MNILKSNATIYAKSICLACRSIVIGDPDDDFHVANVYPALTNKNDDAILFTCPKCYQKNIIPKKAVKIIAVDDTADDKCKILLELSYSDYHKIFYLR